MEQYVEDSFVMKNKGANNIANVPLDKLQATSASSSSISTSSSSFVACREKLFEGIKFENVQGSTFNFYANSSEGKMSVKSPPHKGKNF